MNIVDSGCGLITSHRRSRIRGDQASSTARSVTCNHRSVLRLSVVTAILAVLLTVPVSSTFGAVPRQTPPIYSSANTGKRVVALTFDDGPSTYTPQVLSILRQQHVPATFFVIGEQVAGFAQYVRDERAQGDLVGDHTWTHPDLVQLSADQVRGQLSQTAQAIHAASGYWPVWFRPPYGSVDGQVVDVAASLGLRTVLWSVDPQDWALPGTAAIEERVLSAARPGSVILMHDGGGDRSETVAALPTIIDTLKARGYRFDTLDQLFGFAPAASCPPHPARLFSASHITAHPHHAIYKAWLALICQGRNLGPATTDEFTIRPGVTAQDFSVTAHRIEWIQSARRTRLIVRWGVAAGVFSKNNVNPEWGHPLTQAWMQLFLRDHNRGPALNRPFWMYHHLRQKFLRGTAIQQPDGSVKWVKLKDTR